MAELFNVAKGKKVNALGSNTAAITDGITEAGVHWDGGAAPAQAIVDLGGFYISQRPRSRPITATEEPISLRFMPACAAAA